MSQHADQHFDKISKKYVDLRPIHPPLLNELANILNLRQGASVLDLGCGPGHDLEFLIQQFGVTGQGIDKSTGMVEVAHESYNRTFVLQADALRYLQNSKRNYDAVLLKFFAHHITNHYELFKNIYLALSSKGKVAIVTMREKDLNTFPLLRYFPSLSYYMETTARKLSMIPSLLQEVGFTDCSERVQYKKVTSIKLPTASPQLCCY